MAKKRHRQVSLGAAQPPFPGGWVSALLRTVGDFAPELAERHDLPKRHRTLDRLEDVRSEVMESNYEKWRAVLVRIVTDLFPRVSRINGFAKKYVDEYFRLWAFSAEHAPRWVEIGGHPPASQQVLARALVRDLLLRLCYLESCERWFAGRTDTMLLQCSSFRQFYELLIEQRQQVTGVTQEALAEELEQDARTLRQWKSGTRRPSWGQLCQLAPGGDQRILGGVSFLDLLLRRLKLRRDPMADELIQVVGLFGRTHPAALNEFCGEVPIKEGVSEMRQVGFEEFAGFKGNLLLHPGWDRVHNAMPDSLWRVHVHALRFARPFELAQAYLRFATPESEQIFREILEQCELRGDGDPLRFDH